MKFTTIFRSRFFTLCVFVRDELVLSNDNALRIDVSSQWLTGYQCPVFCALDAFTAQF